MKKYYAIALVAGFILLGLLTGHTSHAPTLGEKPFITRWKVTTSQTIHIPLQGDYAYKWSRVDGTGTPIEAIAHIGERNTLELPAEEGEYELQAGPEGVTEMHFRTRNGNTYGSFLALTSVERWGDVVWENLD